jgi:hypothetical protein
MYRGVLSLMIGLPAATLLFAEVASGPAAGEAVPPLKVQAVVGMIEDKEVDYAAERKDKPTIYVFVKSKDGGIPEGGRPAGRYMKKLDEAVKQVSADVYIVAVWLTDDTDKTKEYLPRIQQSLRFENTGLTYVADKDGPQGWGVNADAAVTTVVCNGRKVVKSFGYDTLNETDVPAVTEALKKALGK